MHTQPTHTWQRFFLMFFMGYESQGKRWAENMLLKRGCSHKSVYWDVPETCRRILGSRYQISNPISQMPSLLRHHMCLPDALLTVTYMQWLDCLRADVSSNSGTRRRVHNWADAHMRLTLFPLILQHSHTEPRHQDNWDRQFPPNTFISKSFSWHVTECNIIDIQAGNILGKKHHYLPCNGNGNG